MLFHLDTDFVAQYSLREPKFGFGELGQLVYQRTYSRTKDNGQKEKWYETVERVVNGTFTMLKKAVDVWDEEKYQQEAKTMYDKIFTFKFTPPGRGLWAQGTAIVLEKGLYSSLNNCAFVSTSEIDTEYSKPFLFLMDQLMLGLGVGFDCAGEGKLTLQQPQETFDIKNDHLIEYLEKKITDMKIKGKYTKWIEAELNYVKEKSAAIHVIPDTREGWVDSVRKLLDGYFKGERDYIYDYSCIRNEGEILKIFGGLSSGAVPLIELHGSLHHLLSGRISERISITTITDICNLIAKTVVSGNIRRSSEIALSRMSEEFINLKNYKENIERNEWSWCSNNSIIVDVDEDISQIVERIKDNGEPGIFWLDNARKYGRMKDEANYKDMKVKGVNPCGEQSLESYEICCLVEIFPNNHDNKEEFFDTLKYAHLYGKIVTTGLSNWAETNEIVKRNRRIGCSLTGLVQFINRRNKEILKEWCDEGYAHLLKLDEQHSRLMNIEKSIKLTTIKPSGTVSLLAGSTPGVHYPISKRYIRRVRLQNDSDVLKALARAGYTIEKCVGSENTTSVVELPIMLDEGIKASDTVSITDKIKLASLLQKYWSDNQVSVTIDFDVKKESHLIKGLLEKYSKKLKSISFIPVCDTVVYPQMPYEKISYETYQEMLIGLRKVDYSNNEQMHEEELDRYCDRDSCQ